MDKQNLEKMRHSCEHVLTQAMLKLYPELKMAMGPATDDGFYFDFQSNAKVSEIDFPKIEKEMKEIIKQNLPIVKKEISIDDAKDLFKSNEFKQEWIEEIKNKGGKPTVYWTGDKFVDLCKGPHVEATGKIGPFKLLSIAGAYWHGDEKNKMLTRIYGTCFPTQQELDEYLKRVEEAKKRDHRKLGKELDLFVISENIGKGLPLLTAKGALIKKQILDYEYQLETKAGFQHVSTPHIARSEIYKKTGHWDHYRETMYAPFGIDDEEYVLKPMNCPHHYMIYASKPRSYKDLPIRLTEPGLCYRYEKAGEVAGLLRVRALTIDDSHILMTEDQIEEEFRTCIDMVKKMFKAFNLNDFYVRLSLSDPSDAVKYIADEDTWKKAGEKLEKIVKDNNLIYVMAKGEASFYGPKIDFMVKDAIGREWQMSTLQLDLFMGKRLGLVYIDHDGQEKNPIILHRGLTGSIERTLGILIEHFAGAFPLWLSPVHIAIIPISEKHIEYSKRIFKEIASSGVLRPMLINENETLGKKIRSCTLQKIPYMIIIGDKEVTKSENVSEMLISLRTREGKDLGQWNLHNLIKELTLKVFQKSLDLKFEKQ